MPHLLQLDASARAGRSGSDPHGSLTRRLTHRFVEQWRRRNLHDTLTYRDVGAEPPGFISGDWIHAAFTPEERRETWMTELLRESDQLIDEVLAADILVLGLPLYNFNVPASFKAWLDKVVRIDKTFAFNPHNGDHPYLPMLTDRPRHAILLSSRGGHGFDEGGPFAHQNHLEPSVRTALEFIGIQHFHAIAIEHQEDGGKRLTESIRSAESRIDALVDTLSGSKSYQLPTEA